MPRDVVLGALDVAVAFVARVTERNPWRRREHLAGAVAVAEIRAEGGGKAAARRVARFRAQLRSVDLELARHDAPKVESP